MWAENKKYRGNGQVKAESDVENFEKFTYLFVFGLILRVKNLLKIQVFSAFSRGQGKRNKNG